MGIKQKIDGLWNKLRKKTKKHVETADDIAKTPTDSELSVEEVVEREIFPPRKTAKKSKATVARVAKKVAPKTVKNKSDAETAKENPSRPAKSSGRPSSAKSCGCYGKGKKDGTRPTNTNYKMIDPNGDTADAGKS